MKRSVRIAIVSGAVLIGLGVPMLPANAAGTASISGVAFQDVNRNGLQDNGDVALGNKQIFLVDGAGADVASTVTDAAGRYAFTGLSAGSYQAQYDVVAWWDIRSNWVIDGALHPNLNVTVGDGQSAAANFVWRPIRRSTDASMPLSTYTGTEGLQVRAYDDVVSASSIYQALKLAYVTAEAPRIVVRFDFGGTSDTATSVAQSGTGQYSGYQATVNVAYLSWLDNGDQTLDHEYGHAWSLYYAYMVQQDAAMTSYLRARGLDSDARVNTAYEWSVRELIAEDYRQLFGSPNARIATQMNRNIPPAAQIPGLATFLHDTFTTAPAATRAPAPQLTLSGPSASPQVVKTTTDITFTVSAPATARVTVVDSAGVTVRTLLNSSVSGTTTTRWDRNTDAGRRVKSGTYAVRVSATDGTTTLVGTTTVRV